MLSSHSRKFGAQVTLFADVNYWKIQQNEHLTGWCNLTHHLGLQDNRGSIFDKVPERQLIVEH